MGKMNSPNHLPKQQAKHWRIRINPRGPGRPHFGPKDHPHYELRQEGVSLPGLLLKTPEVLRSKDILNFPSLAHPSSPEN